MRSTLRSSAKRGVAEGGVVKRDVVKRDVAVLVGVVLSALAVSGAAEAATMTSYGVDEARANAYSMRAFEGERDGSGFYTDATVTTVSEPAAQSTESFRKGGFCDFTPAC